MFSTLLFLYEGNPPVTGGWPSQETNNTERWCSHHDCSKQRAEQTAELQVISDVMILTRHCNEMHFLERTISYFYMNFAEVFFFKVQMILSQQRFRQWLGTMPATSHSHTNGDSVPQSIYASPGLSMLMEAYFQQVNVITNSYNSWRDIYIVNTIKWKRYFPLKRSCNMHDICFPRISIFILPCTV